MLNNNKASVQLIALLCATTGVKGQSACSDSTYDCIIVVEYFGKGPTATCTNLINQHALGEDAFETCGCTTYTSCSSDSVCSGCTGCDDCWDCDLENFECIPQGKEVTLLPTPSPNPRPKPASDDINPPTELNHDPSDDPLPSPGVIKKKRDDDNNFLLIIVLILIFIVLLVVAVSICCLCLLNGMNYRNYQQHAAAVPSAFVLKPSGVELIPNNNNDEEKKDHLSI